MQTFTALMSLPLYILTRNFMNAFIYWLGILIYLGFVLSYLAATILDPGVVNKDYYLENFMIDKMDIKNYRICRKCKVIMDLDKGCEHCPECDICIIGCDHHCPWTSKCVGKKNIKYFNTFIFMLIVHIFYMVFGLMSIPFASKNSNVNM